MLTEINNYKTDSISNSFEKIINFSIDKRIIRIRKFKNSEKKYLNFSGIFSNFYYFDNLSINKSSKDIFKIELLMFMAKYLLMKIDPNNDQFLINKFLKIIN
jgi:hypothetical protein